MLSTHHYDGKLPIGDLRQELERISTIDWETKRQAFISMESKLSPKALKYFRLIVNEGHCNGNYDASHKWYADDLLYRCYEVLTDYDLLNIQLEEIRGGTCAQGRTHRLFQVLWSL